MGINWVLCLYVNYCVGVRMNLMIKEHNKRQVYTDRAPFFGYILISLECASDWCL